MQYDVYFDFSALDRLGSSFSVQSDRAESILSEVAGFFATLFDYFLYFLDQIGFLWIFAAVLFIVALSRLVIYPFVGGKPISLGTDTVRSKRVKSNDKEG